MSEQKHATPEEQEAHFYTEWARLAAVGRAIQDIDLDYLNELVSYAHATGPILDPTSYRDGTQNLRDQERMVKAAIEFRGVVASIADSNRLDDS